MRKSGVKFGLIGPASKLSKGSGSGGGKLARPIGSKPPPRRRPRGATAIFDANSDEDEEDSKEDPNGVAAVNRRLAAISAKQERQAKKEYEEALAADPSVFDYDRTYDSMQESRQSEEAAVMTAREKEKRQPKYIGNLLKQAKLRQVDSDRVYERKLQKEREEQDKVEGEATMKFVTSAYKKKLMEQKKWELQQKLEEEREERDDVTKTGMSGFYSNLMTKNIAMGGDVEKSAQSAFTTGSKRHTATDHYEMQDGSAKGVGGGEGEGAGSANDSGHDATDANSSAALTRDDEGREVGSDVPSARMVDPRASSSSSTYRDRIRHGDGLPLAQDSNTSKEEHDESDEAINPSGVKRRGDDAPLYDDTNVEERRAGDKRARQDGEVSATVDAKREGIEAKTPETSVEKDKGAEPAVSDVGTDVVEELDEVQKRAAAKEKKEAAIRTARERFLARRKGS